MEYSSWTLPRGQSGGWLVISKKLSSCFLGNFACFFVVCSFVYNIIFFKKIFQEYQQSGKLFESRSVRSDLIQTTCIGKGYQQTTLTGKELLPTKAYRQTSKFSNT